MTVLPARPRRLRKPYSGPEAYSAADALGAAFGAFDFLADFAVLAAARFLGFSAEAFFGAGAAFLVAASPRAGRLRRALEPPVFSARASIKPTASSSVTCSGVLSLGRLALTPLW